MPAMLLVAGCSNHTLPPAGRTMLLPTPRGNMPVSVFKPSAATKAIVLFASGDGGWKDFEERISRGLAAEGFGVAGWDVRRYADLGPYDGQRLAEDAATALELAAQECGTSRPPVILMGYSSGAEQMVSVAASSARPERLAGLLLIAPGHRGRYGIKLTDLLGVPPTGPDTFALAELRPKLTGLKIFQIHGENDPLAQTSWLEGLPGPHRLEVYPDGGHLFKGGPPEFVAIVSRGAGWLLNE